MNFREKLDQLLKLRHRISVRLGLALGGAVLLTFIASMVGLIYLGQIKKAQEVVFEDSIPKMEAAFLIAHQSSNIISAAPRLAAAINNVELEEIRAEIEIEKAEFAAQLEVIMSYGSDDATFREIEIMGRTLLENIETVNSIVHESFVLTDRSVELSNTFVEVETSIRNLLISAIDSQLFYFVTGYRDRNVPSVSTSRHFTVREFTRYRRLVDLRGYSSIGAQLLSSALTLSDKAFMVTLKDRFETNEYGVERALIQFAEDEIHSDVQPMFARVRDIGLAEDGIFETKAKLFELDERKEALFSQNHDLGLVLVNNVEQLVTGARSDTLTAAESSANAITTGRYLLIIVNVISILGALGISFFYVGNRLLRRLDHLSERMRTMAAGDLESEIEVLGKDEIAEMAHALEVFRRHALEVQRLNLVESLAEELSQKNLELESTNEELRIAQDQIVMREKLVALGELTAGVAHEIRNPMNFIMNFAEVSEELLEEIIDEVMEPEKREPPGSEIDTELLDEIGEDLTSNLQRIREHGHRANRIIDDMLKMGRDVQEFAESDINGLLEEHARLAFHSLRAIDSEFQLDLQYDLDESIGNMRVVPQDLGRVFINMVTNAGYATDAKRKVLIAENPNTEYLPTLVCRTKKEGDRVFITFRDNGSGIPQDVIDRIFNPFFTTKPTDKGTGLGLTLSGDIVRTHGGTISVTSEPGEWTEMVIDLPEDPGHFMETASHEQQGDRDSTGQAAE